jgi:hypothetical protein
VELHSRRSHVLTALLLTLRLESAAPVVIAISIGVENIGEFIESCQTIGGNLSCSQSVRMRVRVTETSQSSSSHEHGNRDQ